MKKVCSGLQDFSRMNRNLQKELKDSFACTLPLIWETTGDEKKRAEARSIYMKALTRLVEKNFSYQIGDWCRERGVKFLEHMDGTKDCVWKNIW